MIACICWPVACLLFLMIVRVLNWSRTLLLGNSNLKNPSYSCAVLPESDKARTPCQQYDRSHDGGTILDKTA